MNKIEPNIAKNTPKQKKKKKKKTQQRKKKKNLRPKTQKPSQSRKTQSGY